VVQLYSYKPYMISGTQCSLLIYLMLYAHSNHVIG